MTMEQFAELIKARPFRPFTIQLADGREVRVNHPETIAYDGGRVAAVAQKDAVSIIDLMQVTSLTAAAPDGSAAV
jgi:hypothetical protein